MKRLASALLLFYAGAGYGQTQTSENLLTATTASNNINFNATAGTYRYSYVTGNVTAVGVLPVYDPLQILTLNWSFDALYNCNNSIGGYCGDPEGIEDEIQAFLAVGNEAGDTDAREVFNRRDFNQEWQTFTGTEVYDFGTAYEAVSLRIDGVDRGFWAGNYGPSVRNASVVAIYTPINTNPVIVPDCSNPQNDPSCEGYGESVAVEEQVIFIPEPEPEPEPEPPTFGEQATDVVFGDSADDFLFLDAPDATGKPRVMKQIEPQQVYQATWQEEGMFGLPADQGAPRMKNAPPMQAEPRIQEALPVQNMPQIENNPPIFDETTEPLKVKEKPVKVDELREATSQEIMAEVARARKEPRPEIAPKGLIIEPEPVVVRAEIASTEVAAKKQAEPAAKVLREAAKPAVDLVGMALSLVSQQSQQRRDTSNIQRQYQAMQEMQEMAQASGQTYGQSGNANYSESATYSESGAFSESGVYSESGAYSESATQAIEIAQALAQQTQQQQSNTITSAQLAPPSQAQFEADFNDAIATGQSVRQFLSAQPPDFSRFEIDEPTIPEQVMVQKATVAIKTMSEVEIDRSMDEQLEKLTDSGGFTDQSVTVFLISSNPAFDQYQNVDLTDRDEFYKNTMVYPKNAPRVDPFGILRLGGSETFNDLVDIQWQR